MAAAEIDPVQETSRTDQATSARGPELGLARAQAWPRVPERVPAVLRVIDQVVGVLQAMIYRTSSDCRVPAEEILAAADLQTHSGMPRPGWAALWPVERRLSSCRIARATLCQARAGGRALAILPARCQRDPAGVKDLDRAVAVPTSADRVSQAIDPIIACRDKAIGQMLVVQVHRATGLVISVAPARRAIAPAISADRDGQTSVNPGDPILASRADPTWAGQGVRTIFKIFPAESAI